MVVYDFFILNDYPFVDSYNWYSYLPDEDEDSQKSEYAPENPCESDEWCE